MKEIPWQTKPISQTCERLFDNGTFRGQQCNKPTAICYQAIGGGWMALCESCGQPHLRNPASGAWRVPRAYYERGDVPVNPTPQTP